MKTPVMAVATLTMLGLFSLSSTWAAQREPPAQGRTGSQVLKGEVLKHEGDSLIMQTTDGKEIRLHIGKDTLIPGLKGARLQRGDKVEADVTPDRRALSIRPISQ